MLGDLALVAFGSSKAEIMGLTRYVATAYGGQAVRRNAINPDPIRSEAAEANIESALSEIYARSTLVGSWGAHRPRWPQPWRRLPRRTRST
jgi:NAD(P)-dependent dehydrogenase (short-subunit alcohol dehydrogenase family)